MQFSICQRCPALLIFAVGLASAGDAPLPLEAGNYVVASYKPCAEAPLAGVVAFDGASFVGPHDSNCRSVVLDHHDANYRVETTCKALGDGTPMAHPQPFVRNVRIASRSSFVLTRGHDEVPYALCPAFH